MPRASPRSALGMPAHYTSVAAYGPSTERDASIEVLGDFGNSVTDTITDD